MTKSPITSKSIMGFLIGPKRGNKQKVAQGEGPPSLLEAKWLLIAAQKIRDSGGSII